MLKIVNFIKSTSKVKYQTKMYLRDLRLEYTNVSNTLKKRIKQELINLELGVSNLYIDDKSV
jgi:hypothetical protein